MQRLVDASPMADELHHSQRQLQGQQKSTTCTNASHLLGSLHILRLRVVGQVASHERSERAAALSWHRIQHALLVLQRCGCCGHRRHLRGREEGWRVSGLEGQEWRHIVFSENDYSSGSGSRGSSGSSGGDNGGISAQQQPAA